MALSAAPSEYAGKPDDAYKLFQTAFLRSMEQARGNPESQQDAVLTLEIGVASQAVREAQERLKPCTALYGSDDAVTGVSGLLEDMEYRQLMMTIEPRMQDALIDLNDNDLQSQIEVWRAIIAAATQRLDVKHPLRIAYLDRARQSSTLLDVVVNATRSAVKRDWKQVNRQRRGRNHAKAERHLTADIANRRLHQRCAARADQLLGQLKLQRLSRETETE